MDSKHRKENIFILYLTLFGTLVGIIGFHIYDSLILSDPDDSSIMAGFKATKDPYDQAVFLVPMPFTGFHAYPNIKSKKLNTNDLG